MNKELSTMDLYYLTAELQTLKDAKIDKIFQVGKEEFYFIFHVSGKGKTILYISLPHLILLTKRKNTTGKEPPHFCLMLRKYLSQARLRGVEQISSERILKFTFSTKTATYFLYVELFSKGNVIFCGEDGKIIGTIIAKRYSQREIRGGVSYELPSMGTNIFKCEEKTFHDLLSKSDKESIVKALALELRIGGNYAEELCVRAKIDKNMEIKKIGKTRLRTLYAVFTEMLAQKISARAVFDKVVLKDIVPISFEKYASFDEKPYESFATALDEYLSSQKSDERKTAQEVAKNDELDRLKKSLFNQKKNIASIESSIKENDEKGTKVYENYANVKKIIDILSVEIKKQEPADIKKKLKGHKTIKEINFKDKKVTVEL